MNRMTELLERINYDLPGLKKAKMCYAQGDADGAMDAVIEHFRTRITPKYLFTAKEMEQCKVNGILEDAQETLDHYIYGHKFDGEIDWFFNPTEHKVWMFYHEQTNDPILAYALTLDGLQDGKVTGTIYPLDYPSHVERVKSLSCPIDRVTVTFEDGVQFTLPYQSRRRQINELMPEHGTPKSMQYAPESERELAVILRRERLKRDYHAKPGNVQEYMEKLKKASMRGRLKEAQAAVAAPGRGAPHKGGLDR